MAIVGEYQFIAWARAGIGALLDGAAESISLSIDGAASVSKTAAVYDPSDVVGLDTAAIRQTTPRPGALDFEPNLFPSVELAHPALPWLLSSRADASGRATPWIVLVVVEEQDGVTVTTGAGNRRVLTIDAPADPARELPDLTQTWAWAHAQSAAVQGAPLDLVALARSRGEARGRLIAPRRLAPETRYHACVVPARWSLEVPIQIPVYFAWRFGTGRGGDFASLVRRLRSMPLPVDAGRRVVDISEPGWGLPSSPGRVIEVSGALRSDQWQPPAPPVAPDVGEAILEQIDEVAQPQPSEPPVLPPPFYGSAASGADQTAESPAWQDQLNGDLGQRIAAGLGAAVVRSNQDELVEAAWRATGDAEAANQVVRQAELAAALTQILAVRHLAPLGDGDLLSMARPLLSRVHASSGVGPTLSANVRASLMPNALLVPGLRRLVTRRTATTAGTLLQKIDARTIRPVPIKVLPDGAAAFNAISLEERNRARLGSATPVAIDSAATYWGDRIASPTSPPVRGETSSARRRETEIPEGEGDTTPAPTSEDPDPVAIDEFAAASRVHQAYIVQHLARIPDRAPTPLGDLAVVRATIESQWTPARGVLLQLGARFEAVPPESRGTLRPMTLRPVLERPLIQALVALSLEHVLPGAASIEADTVGLAVSEPNVARAVLIGANEELGRELLWRGFPGALGHTWLRTFWGRFARQDGAVVPVPDIGPIEEWPDAGPTPAAAGVVLVLRGEVLRRYPNALVYANRARWNGTYREVGSELATPAFATTLATDLALFGFDLSLADARGGDVPGGPAGWYFVIAEHPHEPRFGLAAERAAGPPTTWRDVTWSDATDSGSYLRTDGALASLHPTQDEGLTWGSDAAQIAAITLRRPVRIAVHASKLLPGM